MRFLYLLKRICLMALGVVLVSLFCIAAPFAQGETAGTTTGDTSGTTGTNATGTSGGDTSGGASGGGGSSCCSSGIIQLLIAYMNNMTQQDTSTSSTPSTISQIQATFASLGTLFVSEDDPAQPPANLLGLTAQAFNQPLSSFTGKNPQITATVSNINDLTYSSIIGLPPVPKSISSTTIFNYIVNATGASIHHAIPSDSWQGSDDAVQRYTSYFNTVMAAETFNTYTMNQLATENQSPSSLTTLRNTLITQVSSSTWLAQVSVENIGQVLRHILVFESQNYVLMSELLATQKQLLAAQTMTNSLLIAVNANTENYLASRAQGTQPSS